MCLKSDAGPQIAGVTKPHKITNIALDWDSVRDWSDLDYCSVWVFLDGQKILLASLTRQKHHVNIDIELDADLMVFSARSCYIQPVSVYLSGYELQ